MPPPGKNIFEHHSFLCIQAYSADPFNSSMPLALKLFAIYGKIFTPPSSRKYYLLNVPDFAFYRECTTLYSQSAFSVQNNHHQLLSNAFQGKQLKISLPSTLLVSYQATLCVPEEPLMCDEGLMMILRLYRAEQHNLLQSTPRNSGL